VRETRPKRKIFRLPSIPARKQRKKAAAALLQRELTTTTTTNINYSPLCAGWGLGVQGKGLDCGFLGLVGNKRDLWEEKRRDWPKIGWVDLGFDKLSLKFVKGF
jgi:hypothetical protein